MLQRGMAGGLRQVKGRAMASHGVRAEP